MTDCKNCRYRIHLARAFDVHIWKEDCDKYETDICKAMNAPIDSTYPDAKTMTIRINPNYIRSYGERENNG
jgi:hypothetical protein